MKGRWQIGILESVGLRAGVQLRIWPSICCCTGAAMSPEILCRQLPHQVCYVWWLRVQALADHLHTPASRGQPQTGRRTFCAVFHHNTISGIAAQGLAKGSLSNMERL